MVSIAVVGDVHLKLRRNADFELNRFNLLIQHLKNSPASIIIFNGDLLDVARPTLEEIKALNEAMDALHDKQVYIIAGNHEAVTKDKSTYDFLQLPNVIYRTKPVHTLEFEGVELKLVDWNDIDKIHLIEKSDILITHYRSAMEGLYDEEIETAKFINNFSMIILSDIHSRYSPAKNVFYTGSPYPVHHVRDSREDFGYIQLDIDKGSHSWKYVDLNLPKKIRLDVKAEDIGELKLNDDYIYKIHVEGTLDELSKIKPIKNAEFVKHVTQTTVEPLEPAKDIDFFDNLTEHVNNRLTVKTKKTKEILLKLQEG